MSKIDHSASDNQDKNDLKLCGDKVKTNSNYFRSRQRKASAEQSIKMFIIRHCPVLKVVSFLF